MPKVGKKSGQAVNLHSKLDRIHETWKPKIIAELNDAYVKLVKVKGEFVWHHHEREDELFLVLKGRLRIELRDGPWTSERASLRSSRAASSIDTRRRGRGPCPPARAEDHGEHGAGPRRPDRRSGMDLKSADVTRPRTGGPRVPSGGRSAGSRSRPRRCRRGPDGARRSGSTDRGGPTPPAGPRPAAGRRSPG